MPSIKTIISITTLLLFSQGTVAAHEFTWHNLLNASAKMTENFDYQNYVDSYMQLYRKQVWQKYHDDEFALQDKRKETIKIMKEKFESFDASEPFVIRTELSFGKYDFENNIFPVNGLEKGTYFPQSHYNTGAFPHSFELHVKSVDRIGDLSMPKNEARKFINSRKDTNGDVDRTIFAKLLINPTGSSSDLEKVEGELVKVTLFSDQGMQQQIQEF